MRRKKRRGPIAWFIELAIIIAVALGLALLIQAVLVKPFKIPSESMEPTLAVGQRVIVNRVVYSLRDPNRRDVVVFHPPAGALYSGENQCGVQHSGRSACPEPTKEQEVKVNFIKRIVGLEDKVNFIKRIVGLPGDRLAVRDGIAIINGKPLKEPYTRSCGGLPACNLPESIKIPPDHYFMMGDNRGASDDSRFWGPIPKEWIIGEGFLTYWPPNKIGTL